MTLSSWGKAGPSASLTSVQDTWGLERILGPQWEKGALEPWGLVVWRLLWGPGSVQGACSPPHSCPHPVPRG